MGAKLGQHFLFDQGILERIASVALAGPDDTVVEIGPGPGTLTRVLAQRVSRVIAIELDRNLYARLKAELMAEGIHNVELHHGDALRFDYSSLGRFKVVANIPYQITTPLIFLLLGYKDQIVTMTLTIQREVALRIAAPPGGKAYGVLSLAVQYQGIPSVEFIVPACAFKPPPKVDSACLHIGILMTPAVDVKDEELMFRVIRAGFSQRRKTLHNALGKMAADIDGVLKIAGIAPGLRAETLSMVEFARIADAICSLNK